MTPDETQNPPETPEPPAPPEQPPAPETPPPPPPATPPAAAVGAGKADLGKRFVGILIDGVLAMIVGFIPVVGGLIGAAYMLVRDGLEIDFMDRRSLGKKLVKLRPVRLDGQPMDITASVKRNIPFAIGPLIMVIPVLGWVIGPVVALIIGIIEVILVVTDDEGRRMGDKFAETKVIEVEQ
ncbi:MAG: RDD family protein [Acidobacteria bacterium]|nr:RDD family protein [Acidobacteriota bacterium]